MTRAVYPARSRSDSTWLQITTPAGAIYVRQRNQPPADVVAVDAEILPEWQGKKQIQIHALDYGCGWVSAGCVVLDYVESTEPDRYEAKRIARLHLESPEVRQWRREHPDAPVSGRGGIFDRPDFDGADLSSVHPDRDHAWEELVEAGWDLVQAERSGAGNKE